CCFFFQAEDGIRDATVTGVQTVLFRSGSGKTALVLALCRALRDRVSLGVVTNDIFTREDAEFLVRNEALPRERIRAVETGGCPQIGRASWRERGDGERGAASCKEKTKR